MLFSFSYLSSRANGSTGARAAAAAAAADPFAEISLSAESAYVYDIAAGRALYTKNPRAQLPLASLTKVPLALVVSDVLWADAIVSLPHDVPLGNSSRLASREKWRVGDVINAMLVTSSNDLADMLATAAHPLIQSHYAGAPSERAVLWRMNELARELGLAQTYFLNVSGLDMSATQAGAYGSAHDVAALFAYAARSAPATFAATTRDSVDFTSFSGTSARAVNTDKALGAIPGVIMGKTGFTDLAGGNLAVIFDVGPSHPVVAVVLHSTEGGRFDDMKKLVAATVSTITGAP